MSTAGRARMTPMCDCGCSNFDGGLKFPGPNGSTYVLRIYPGCSNCDSPVGVDIYRFDAKHDRFVDEIRGMIDQSPDLLFHEEIRGMHVGSEAVLDANILRREGVKMGLDEVSLDEIADNLEVFVHATSRHFDEIKKTRDLKRSDT